MLISLNWLKKYVDVKIPNDELITLIGARLVEVEGVIDQTHKYDNIFVAHVVSCEKIPDTHLSLCQIDIGEASNVVKFLDCPQLRRGFSDEARNDGPEERVQKLNNSKTHRNDSLVQVLCGANNVRKDMLAVWIAPGATVPSSTHEDAPFVIGTRKMQGYVSNGMLASLKELDFGDDYDGIAELEPGSATPGAKLADLFELEDLILEIENKSLTHRPDTFGLIGFAREVAGILDQPFKTPEFLTDNTQDFVLSENKTELKVTIKDPKLCPRYTALVFARRGEMKDKYLDLQDTLLARSGMRPIDPIIDLTNYLMLLTGQPLHAFDYDKLVAVAKSEQPEIIVRAGQKGDKLQLIDDREIEITENDIVITANNTPVALAGAMGGKNTEIDKTTRRVILESATFSLYNLRRTQMTHGIFSEAITRFTKGQPAYQTLPVAKEFATSAASYLKFDTLIDEYPNRSQLNVVKITTQEINSLLGSDYSPAEIQSTLENVGFKVTHQFEITPPLWRIDIRIKEDIIEEIGRLGGYDNITPSLPLHATATKDNLLSLKKDIRNILASFGANELLTYSFVHGDFLEKFGQNPKNSYKITNSISPDLQYIRQQIAPSLFTKAYDNLKSGYGEFTLFEMNQVYLKSDGLNSENVPKINNNLALVFASKPQNTCYYEAKYYLEQLLLRLGFTIELKPIKTSAKYESFYEPKRSATIFIGEVQIGIIGELKNSVANSTKLPSGTAAFELSIDELLKLTPNYQPDFNINQFPSVNRDLSLEVANGTKYADIYRKIQQELGKTGLNFNLTPVSIFQKTKTQKTLTFHLELSHSSKTLEGSEISAIMKTLENIK